ncbi:MAG: hypothetical protein U5N85_01835 [Arcicella sp.]|nr:hypothetical protein [Arcicella sp.]
MGAFFDYDRDKIIITYSDNKPKPTYTSYSLHQNQLTFLETNAYHFDNCYAY